ncbi:MAG TPA: nucleoside triphosphate pyrophosphohydrolase [Gammaproteobacteria bacterium]|nr:nucleoside triphosphate pyrophosphohydrolase [Gammaproteobacteria bacterium]
MSVGKSAERENITALLDVMARLRDPECGCPWDLQQDFRSIAPYTLEEAYEVVDAIEAGDAAALRDELGDLLFQVVFHARLASEAGWFDFPAVVDAIVDKMLRRHPHVFADAVVEDAEAQARAWEVHKRRERSARSAQDSLLEGIPLALPALTRAHKLQQKAARAGFDWPDIGGVLDKVIEELAEFRAEIGQRDNRAALLEESGDVLFAVVNLLRHAGIDPEAALRAGNRKFERRFQHVEALCRAAGQDVAGAGLETLEQFWQMTKDAEREDGKYPA